MAHHRHVVRPRHIPLIVHRSSLTRATATLHSTGLGRDLTLAALARGDKVIATARGRSFGKLDDLKQAGADVLELDVTAPLERLKEAAERAVAIYGRVDVVVNNAGRDFLCYDGEAAELMGTF